MRTTHSVTVAGKRDRLFVLDLQKRFSQEVGFIPAAAIEKRLSQGEILIARENGDPAGYLLAAARISTAPHIRPIFQAAIRFDAQRRGAGLQLLEQLAAAARTANQSILQCFCRQELEANDFWRAAGFVAVALRHVNAKRGRPTILWRRPLVRMTPATLIELAANPRAQGAAGRSIGRYDWHRRPMLELLDAGDVAAQLQRCTTAA